ncbi:hypothetical protein MWU78_20565 [Arenibacter sp. F26102]|uniref:hypothetical protein n=1 Tax=Arenibacter sp. F26102 TaxID=2926416 RepID=UPI001FF465F0|nr:hypothetical protein [Arenibacter sp. F26102]MCK0148051.1 hypothetical protein [Arenibacter sp. F26102]
METNVIYLLIALFLGACQDSPKTENKEDGDLPPISVVEMAKVKAKENIKEQEPSNKDVWKALKSTTPLSSEQILPFLPKMINGHKMANQYAYPGGGQMATGGYGPADNQHNFSIEDGAGSKAIVKNFFNSYILKLQGPVETEYIYLERDGYETIAFLQPKISRNQIAFIYNNRFRISLEGPDKAIDLWSYIDFENLKKLDQYK